MTGARVCGAGANLSATLGQTRKLFPRDTDDRVVREYVEQWAQARLHAAAERHAIRGTAESAAQFAQASAEYAEAVAARGCDR
jgi:hypothetical protein